MSLTKQFVTEALRQVPGATAGTDLVSGGNLVWVAACDGTASIRLSIPNARTPAYDAMARAANGAVLAAARRDGLAVDQLVIEFVDAAGKVVHTARFGTAAPAGAGSPSAPAAGPSTGHTPIGGLRGPPPSPQAGASGLPGVTHIIAVGAGKGGVGKSTIALNLAVGLARRGKAVGLLDGDIYGPSMPTMLGLDGLDPVTHEGMIQPFLVHGIKCVTMGKLVAPDQPLIWRGPMAHGAFKQLAEQTRWGELDYLVIDLPPGTGDVSLTMAQALRLTGAVVVCTPQKVAQDDAVRAAKMFKQLGVEVLGVVENMSTFVGDDGKTYDIFGRGGAEQMAQRLGVPFLGAVPITMSLRVNSDGGDPTANFAGGRGGPAERALAERLEVVVTNVESQAALASMRQGQSRPVLKVR